MSHSISMSAQNAIRKVVQAVRNYPLRDRGFLRGVAFRPNIVFSVSREFPERIEQLLRTTEFTLLNYGRVVGQAGDLAVRDALTSYVTGARIGAIVKIPNRTIGLVRVTDEMIERWERNNRIEVIVVRDLRETNILADEVLGEEPEEKLSYDYTTHTIYTNATTDSWIPSTYTSTASDV